MKYTKFTFNPFQENTYVLWDETKDCIIIDPGCYYPQEFGALKGFIAKEDLKPIAIVNTHCHIDHVLGVQECIEEWKLPFYGHKLENLNLDRLDFQAEMFGLPLKNASPQITNFLDDGGVFKFGSTELEVLFVPGHSPGHLAFYNKESSTLVSGDVLFRNSIGRTDLPGCDHNDLITSIKSKLFLLPDNTTVLAGHMQNTTIGFEKKTNPFLQG